MGRILDLVLFAGALLFLEQAQASQHFWVQPDGKDLKDVVVANDEGGGADGFYTYSFGKAMQRHASWNVGDFSHLNTPTPWSDFQASIDPNGYGSTSVQKQGAQATIHLHSYSLPNPSPMGWYYVGWNHQVNRRPWDSNQFGSDPKMCLEHSETVIDSYSEGAVFYNGVVLWLTDKNGRPFSYSIKTWDSRWPDIGISEGAYYDAGLSSYYVGSAYTEGRKYLSLMPFSHAVTGAKGENLRWYGMCISKEQLALAIADMNAKNSDSQTQLDADTTGYQVTAVQLSSEIANLSTPKAQGGAGWYTSRFAGIYLYTDY
ncbi:hypothetical protein NG829_03710 [Xanthomonas sacchari]|uniref:hypothetical protein n=1 Tax=Xanthomonas sacchari TaxID=56458 RepID=UPI00225E4F89|nr:hypothetical protein [Xanthomonas sacchari]UYK81434.1 hypothetical protein NG829_03710 [Xanthomonas sacchari]